MRRSTLTGAALAALAILFVAPGDSRADTTRGYVETDLITNRANLNDVNGIVHPLNNPNAIVDANLLDAWDITEDITESATSRFWVSANGSGTAERYNVLSSNPLVASNSLSVSIPPPGKVGFGRATGAVFNTTVNLPASQQEFIISGFAQPGCSTNTAKAAARLLVATEQGTIVGWAPALYPTQSLCMAGGTSTHGIIAVNHFGGAHYKGLAIATDRTGATFLYAPNFLTGQVEIYDGTFNLITTFTDPHLPTKDESGAAVTYVPFNIVPITVDGNLELFVAFAVQEPSMKRDDVAGPGHGIVDTFDLAGNMLHRFATGGALNSPWGVALAPNGFGELSGKLLIGNFGDGKINAFDPETDPETGRTSVPLNNSGGQPMVIDGLWAIKFGNHGRGRKTLYFAAGPNGEADGLLGGLTPTRGQNAQGNQNEDEQGSQ
jgi:uncharacterized protein (TIGR03118 family)